MKLKTLMAASLSLFALFAFAGCAADTEGDEGDTATSEDKLLAGRKVPESEVAELLRDAGFPEDVVPTMVCTAKWESSFFERAYNKNKNGSKDYGLFQINSVHLGDENCPTTIEGLYTASKNAQCAFNVYSNEGLTAWVGYKKHKTECNNYKLK
ncbi:transglycosylase SLT domain-containing protein [Labilithrix luteola]|nr:transglycosylase SLT domain-containing protein [Labilithrix luteola]